MAWLVKKLEQVKGEFGKKRPSDKRQEDFRPAFLNDQTPHHQGRPNNVVHQQFIPPRHSHPPPSGRVAVHSPRLPNAPSAPPKTGSAHMAAHQIPIQMVGGKQPKSDRKGLKQHISRPLNFWHLKELEFAFQQKWATEDDLARAKLSEEKGEASVVDLFKLPETKVVNARKYSCKFVPGKPIEWKTEEIQVQLEEKPLSSGSLRVAYRMYDLSRPLGKRACVAKQAKEEVDGENIYFTDVAMQEECRYYAEMFNARGPPKKVEFLESWVIEILANPERPRIQRLFGAEPFLCGKYIKHSNNFGFATDRNTPQAFSHFTYEATNGERLVVDIQGVHDSYTDPQIHSTKETDYGVGNLGRKGFAKFFETHKCNAVCRCVGLTLSRNVKGMEEGTHAPNLGPNVSGRAGLQEKRPKSRASDPQSF